MAKSKMKPTRLAKSPAIVTPGNDSLLDDLREMIA
jgi:hypothetical protein